MISHERVDTFVYIYTFIDQNYTIGSPYEVLGLIRLWMSKDNSFFQNNIFKKMF